MDITSFSESTVTEAAESPLRDRRRRAAREAQLIEASLDCIATLGLRDTTVQDLAAKAGMAVGSISQYFSSKEALYTAALRSLAEEFEDHWQSALGCAAPEPVHRLLALVDAYFDPAICQRRKVAVWFAYWGEVRARPQYRTVCEDFDAAYGAAIATAARDLLAQEGRAQDLAEPLARLISATCQGLWLDFLSAADRPTRASLHALARRQLVALFPSQAPTFRAEESAQ